MAGLRNAICCVHERARIVRFLKGRRLLHIEHLAHIDVSRHLEHNVMMRFVPLDRDDSLRARRVRRSTRRGRAHSLDARRGVCRVAVEKISM